MGKKQFGSTRKVQNFAFPVTKVDIITALKKRDFLVQCIPCRTFFEILR